jgi:hypothetical protein
MPSTFGITVHESYAADGTLKDQTVEAEGFYLSLRGGVIGYAEKESTAPSSVDITINGVTQNVSMGEHPDYPTISVGEVSLPTSRPVKATVQGVTEHIYRASMLPDGVDRSHEVGGGYDVILTPEAQTQVRSFAFQAANALNNGSKWPNIKGPRPPKAPVDLVKQDLLGFTKMKWAEPDTVEAGDVLSHDNSATRGLWKADVDTTSEPTKDSSDWTLVFELTV